MTTHGTAGTPADGYRLPPAQHVYRPTAHDPGLRPYCVVCGQEPHRGVTK